MRVLKKLSHGVKTESSTEASFVKDSYGLKAFGYEFKAVGLVVNQKASVR